MTPTTTHPLVASWLRDLDLLLYGIEPGERAEVLAGVREHLDASLPPGSGDDDVRAVLAELGPPQAVADEAYAGRPPMAPQRLVRPSPWPAYCACLMNTLMLVVLTALALKGVNSIEWLLIGTLFAIPWIFLIVLTSMAEAWTPSEKFTSIGVVPGTLVALTLTTMAVGAAVPNFWIQLSVAVAVIGASLWMVVSLARAARRRGPSGSRHLSL